MAFFKMSKQQIKNNQIIDAWLDNEPFKLNNRDKNLQVPVLSPWEVRQMYTPLYPGDTGQFFSTQRIANEFGDFVAHDLCIDVTGKTILEPSAGLAALVEWTKDFAEKVVCFEADRKLVEIGRKMEPWIEWVQNSPFDQQYWPDMEGQFDLVFGNPPYGTTWAMLEADEFCQSGAKRSEHRFLELAIRALKPGGMVIFIAPVNFVEKMPKAMQEWAKKNISFGLSRPVEGQFELTKIATSIFAFQKPFPPRIIPADECWQLTRNEFRAWAEKGGYLGAELTLETADALHQSTVEKAINDGKPVLSKVLRDYPKLTPKFTPLYQQYLDIKANYPDCILLFRLGDFYEAFNEDAEILARELDIPLTSRPTGVGIRAPLAGVPWHTLDAYLPRLLDSGHHAVVAEIAGEESKGGVYPREITRDTRKDPVPISEPEAPVEIDLAALWGSVFNQN